MTTGMVHQLATLQRIAVFSAAVRGHDLGEWHTGENFAQAGCIHCGAALRLYRPAAFEPEMDGPALEDACGAHAVAGRAA